MERFYSEQALNNMAKAKAGRKRSMRWPLERAKLQALIGQGYTLKGLATVYDVHPSTMFEVLRNLHLKTINQTMLSHVRITNGFAIEHEGLTEVEAEKMREVSHDV